MCMRILLDTIKKRSRLRSDAQLARMLNVDHAVITRLRKPNATLSDTFLIRCYDYGDLSISETRELYYANKNS